MHMHGKTLAPSGAIPYSYYTYSKPRFRQSTTEKYRCSFRIFYSQSVQHSQSAGSCPIPEQKNKREQGWRQPHALIDPDYSSTCTGAGSKLCMGFHKLMAS